ncbi:M56 family metallopeptidase [Undibacterium terreum]|uniref:Peptidase M56 domain-containing protein n=1 Tax=Undibacterium terreum TaxID=1224302 RepID=A0A916UD47_9BURK|nr:M56 family metallopeptidase [Undibacterium terreum]GGC69264.1 hypothetical protein GCM10011396_15370 [Undibacterium terreum]
MNAPFELTSAIAHVLLHSLWQLALLAFLAALSFSLLGKSSARIRHAVGMAWMMAMLAAPLLTFILFWQAFPLFPAGEPGIAIVTGIDHGSISNPPWADWILVFVSGLWLAGVACMLALQLGGWRLINSMEQQAYLDLPAEWLHRSQALRTALGITRTVAIRVASHVASPFTAHLWRPVIWLPASLLTHLPPEQLEALLAHELAHIRRLDWLWNGLQCAVESLLFFHPAMWWLSKRIRQEREHACDDLAVEVCGDAIVLAEALTALTTQRHRPSLPPRFALAAKGGSLMKRITHLLSSSPAPQNWRVPVALLLLLCSGTLLATQIVPPKHLLTNLKINASSSGELTAGNFREFTASYLLDKQRYYRISMDDQGRVKESYKEDGHDMPVDEKVRVWLKELEPMDTPPLPPQPPRPPLPPLPPLPEIPPLPLEPVQPPPARASDSTELRALFSKLQNDRQLLETLGTPVNFERDSFHGSIRIWGSWDFRLWGLEEPEGGKAAFSMVFSGPKGKAKVTYAGTTHNGIWQTAKLDISPFISPLMQQ